MAAPSSSLQENKWLEVYIDALADRGGSRLGPEETALVRKGEALAVPLGMHFFATQASQAPPEALARAWRRASAGGPHSERESRVTNTSWRLWHMAMRRENARLEELAAARQRPSYGADIPEEDSDVEDEADQDNDDKAKEMEPSSPSARENPLVHFAPDESLPRPPPLPPRSLYVVMISLHGLVRGHEMELGKDADTGGQVKYVVDMARELGKHPLVARVDLLTRLIEDPAVDPSYANPLEPLDESGRSFIVRIPCGDPAVYLPKEQLWPHVREFSDRAVPTIGATLESLNKDDADGESHTHVRLACVHGHYADAGEVASNIACTLGVPMVLTGHSLGRNKREHLLRAGRLTPAEIERKYNISRRIEGEERALNVADMVVTSTAQEIAEQWALYDGYAPRLASVLRKTAASTRYGRSMALMKIIPPGVGGLEAVAEDASPNANNARDQAEGAGDDASSSPTERSMPLRKDASHASSIADLASMDEAGAPTPAFWEAANRFLRQPGKPVILAMCRPDAKKNVTSLVKAFGSTPGLKDIANLVLVLGTRDNVEELSVGAQAVVNDVLHLIDRYDVYGSVAMPKHHTQADVPDIYKLAFSTGGVFVNVALQEPFGLTLIEAASHGVPIVATCHGGPVDIHRTLKNGMLVEPRDVGSIGEALLELVTDRQKWSECSKNGLDNIHKYSWASHCDTYIDSVLRCRGAAAMNAAAAAVAATPNAKGDSWGALNVSRSADYGDAIRALGEDLASEAEDITGGTHSDGEPIFREIGGAAGLRGTAEECGYNSDSIVMPEASPAAESFLLDAKDVPPSDPVTPAASTDGSPPAPLLVVAVDACALAAGARALARALQEPDIVVGAASEVPIDELAAALEAEGEQIGRLAFATAAFGTEMYVPSTDIEGELERSETWGEHVGFRWRSEGYRRGMRHAARGWLELDEACSSELLLTYREVGPQASNNVGDRLAVLRRRLRTRGLHCSILQNKLEGADVLQLMPSRAGRAHALRFFAMTTGRAMATDVAVLVPSLELLREGLSDYNALVFEGAQRAALVGSPGKGTRPAEAPLTFFPDAASAVRRCAVRLSAARDALPKARLPL